MLNKLQLLVRSRKFWASFIGLFVIVLRHFIPNFPIEDADLTRIVFVIVAYVLGTAIEDSGTSSQVVAMRIRGLLSK
jgi:hypothetical protein